MSAASDAVYVTTPNGVIISANEAMAKRFDRSPESLVGSNVFDLSPLTAADLQRRALGEAAKTKRAVRVEYDYSNRYFYDTVYPLWAENGDVNGLVVFSTEVTERKQSEQSLAERKECYKSILQQQTELVARYNPDFTLTFVNEAYCRYFAKPEHELLGRSFFTLIPKEGWEPVRQHFTLFTPEESVHVHQHLVIAPDGTRRWQQWTNRAFFDDSGKIHEYQSGGIDITERKLAEEKTQALLNQNRNLTQRLFKAQEDERRHLARELHDEFGQWLAVIQLHSHNLTQRIDKQLPDIRASIAAISNSVARMQQDMHDMIHSLRPALLDELGLGDSLRELVAQWQDHNRGTECTLKLEGDLENLGETLNITVYRLVQEGLTNIAKHAQANQAAVRLCRQQMCQRQGDAEKEDCITLTIQDNGKGIDSHLPTNGYGLAGMRERVLAVGGHFSIDDSHEQGVRLVAKLFISHNNICDVGS